LGDNDFSCSFCGNQEHRSGDCPLRLTKLLAQGVRGLLRVAGEDFVRPRTTEIAEAAKEKQAAKRRPQHGARQQNRAPDRAKPARDIGDKGARDTTQTAAEKQHEEESKKTAAKQQEEERSKLAAKKQERKTRRKQKRQEIRALKTTLHEQHRLERKALLEEETETRAERKRLATQHKQREDKVAASAMWTTEWLEQEGFRSPEQREREEAARKKDEKRYRDNAKEKRKKTAEAAQADEWAFESMQRCLVEGQETLLETMKYEVRPTTIKAAAKGEIFEATVNGHFVAAKEAGQGQPDEAEAAWIEREEEMARVKSTLAKVTRDIKDSQRDIFDMCDLGQGMNREWIEKDRRQVEELYARNREERHKEKLELKWKIVAGEVLGHIRKVRCLECQWHTKWRIEAGQAVGRVWRTRCEECRWPTHVEVLTEMRLAREDRVSGAAVQGDFEAAVTVVQCGGAAERRWSALAPIPEEKCGGAAERRWSALAPIPEEK
jgi:hypothetical protein